MISKEALVAALHKGAYRATAEYYDYSKTFLTKCAGESYMVACMAQDIKRTSSVPFLCLEYCNSTFTEDLKTKIKGRPSGFQNGSGRIDMAILNKDRQLKFAIEAKCNAAWNDITYKQDLDRLIWFKNKLRRTETQHDLIASIFIALVSSSSKISFERAKSRLSTKITTWEENIESYFGYKNSPQYFLSKGNKLFSGIEYYKIDCNTKFKIYTISTSLCCIIE